MMRSYVCVCIPNVLRLYTERKKGFTYTPIKNANYLLYFLHYLSNMNNYLDYNCHFVSIAMTTTLSMHILVEHHLILM